MIKYLVSIENRLAIGWASSADSVPYLDYTDITNVHIPDCAPEFWLIENSEIKIDQVKLAQFNRQQMPQLTPIEFDIKLNNAGLYDAVQDLIKDNFEMRIAYNRATFFSRTDPIIDQARIVLGLTDEQVDTIWESSLVL